MTQIERFIDNGDNADGFVTLDPARTIAFIKRYAEEYATKILNNLEYEIQDFEVQAPQPIAVILDNINILKSNLPEHE